MQIFEYSNYRSALRGVTESRRRQFGGRFTFDKVAQAAGMQKTYLSRVLKGDGNLNADQLFSACQFLKMKDFETDYILLLREQETSLNKDRRRRIAEEMKKLQKVAQRTEVALSLRQDLGAQNWSWEYFTDPDIQLVHMFLTVSRFSNDPSLISQKLGISSHRLQNIILRLQEWGLIVFSKDKYTAKECAQHLSETSPIFPAFASSQRVRCLNRARHPLPDEDFFFTVLFSGEERTRLKLREDLLKVLQSAQSEVEGAKANEVFQLNIDLMKWS